MLTVISYTAGAQVTSASILHSLLKPQHCFLRNANTGLGWAILTSSVCPGEGLPQGLAARPAPTAVCRPHVFSLTHPPSEIRTFCMSVGPSSSSRLRISSSSSSTFRVKLRGQAVDSMSASKIWFRNIRRWCDLFKAPAGGGSAYTNLCSPEQCQAGMKGGD